MKARDLMGSPAITISADGTVGDAADLMLGHNVSCLPVLDAEGRLVGILTHADFGLHHKFFGHANNLFTLMGAWATPATIEQVSREVRRRGLREVMSHPVTSVSEDDDVAEVVATMLRHKVHRVPVMRGQEIVGVVSRHDLLKLMAAPNGEGHRSGGGPD